LPAAKKQRFQQQYGLSDYDAEVLTAQRALADYYEDSVSRVANEEKLVANWVMGDLSAGLNREGLDITDCPVSAERLAGLVLRISDQTISGKIAKRVFELMWGSIDSADTIIDREGLKQISDSGELEKMIDQLMADNMSQVEQFREGKTKVMGFFVGQLMKQTQGKANPQELNKLLQAKLKK